jgi:hypothetical protein
LKKGRLFSKKERKGKVQLQGPNSKNNKSQGAVSKYKKVQGPPHQFTKNISHRIKP